MKRYYNGATQLADKKNNSFRYQFTHYTAVKTFKGSEIALIHTQDIKGWRFNNSS